MANLSKTQIDRLGDRLKKGPHTESDLRLLDEYRSSFGEAYESVLQTIRQRSQFPTGRIAKSTLSIVEKLRRESIRLSQMQDIAGCRIVVANIMEQNQLVAVLKTDFPQSSITDRRKSPSYGYRAIHIVAEISEKPIEIQVRTSLQHMWAELSEKASDVIDPAIKYGGGPQYWRNILLKASELVTCDEDYEIAHFESEALTKAVIAAHQKIKKVVADLLELGPTEEEASEARNRLEASTHGMRLAEQEIEKERIRFAHNRDVTATELRKLIFQLDKLKEQDQ